MNKRPRGISLIEIIVVITIMSMMMSAVGVYSLGVHREAQIRTAKMDVKTALAALDVYRATTGHYPDPREGFAPVIKVHALRELPTDPWGHLLAWDLRDGEPVVTSFGADGVAGGAEDNADLTSAAR
jgi:general secretion pathway protein G